MANEFIARKGIISLDDAQVTGSLSVTGNISASIFTGSFVGDGSQLSGVSAGFPFTGSAEVTGSLTVTGSVSATTFLGDGSQLTGIGSPIPVTATVNTGSSPLTLTTQSIVIADSTDGDITINLPDLDAIVGTSDQKPIVVYKNDYSQNVIYVQPSGSQLVNGASQDIIVSIQLAVIYNPTSAGWVTEGTSAQSLAELELFFVPRTETGSFATTGSNQFDGNQTITGSLTVTGGINATITGSATSASYVEYTDVANKPTLVSGSTQISFNGITDKPALVSSSAQIVEYGIFATTGSNQFDGNQAITGSLTVTGQVVAQTLNVQQVTSSIVFSSGSNIFGNSLSNTQQFTGSVSVTGSLTVNGVATSGTVSGTSNYVGKFTGTNTIGNSAIFDGGGFGGFNNTGVAARTFVVQATSSRNIALEVIESANVHAIYMAPNNSGFNRISSDYMSGGVFLPLSLTGRENNTDLVLQTNGNIGIGTASPSEIFHVNKNNAGNIVGGYFTNSQANTGAESVSLAFGLNRSGGDFVRQIKAITFGAEQQWTGTESTVDGYLSFSTVQNEAISERMRITSGGNVGIGNNPSYKLDITNSVAAVSSLDPITLRLYNGSDGGSAIYFQNSVGGQSKISFGVESTGAGTDDSYLGFSTGANTALTEQMRVTSGGRVGIGVTNPDAGLQIAQPGQDDQLTIGSIANNRDHAAFMCSGANKAEILRYQSATRLIIGSSGNISNLDVVPGGTNGVRLSAGNTSWSAFTSDERKKKNFETVPGLEALLQVNPIKYHFRTQDDSEVKKLGFTAQNLLPLIPEMVHSNGEKADDGTDILTIIPDYILPVLVKAIQEQQSQIESLKAEIQTLKQ
jgi:hypothetical protein